MSELLDAKVNTLFKEAKTIAPDCIAAAKDDTCPADTVSGLVQEIEGCLAMIKFNMRGVGEPDFTHKHAAHLREQTQEMAGKALLLAAGLRRVRGES